MLPEKMIPEYMDQFYLKSHSFYDKTNKVSGCSLKIYDQSMLREQTLTITFRHP